MKTSAIAATIFTTIGIVNYAYAVDLTPNDTRTPSQKDFDRTERQVKAEYDRQQAEKTRESMRDKSHDGRLPIGNDTSVGIDRNGVNVRKSIP